MPPVAAAEAAGWQERLIPAVPGLAALAYGFVLPDELQPLFSAVLAVVCFAAFAVVLLSRGKIRRWSIRRAVRWVAALAAGALLSLFLFFVAQSSLVRGYRYPLGSDSTVVVLMPTRVSLFPPGVTFPFRDCREAMGSDCASPVMREAESGDQLEDLLARHGSFDIQLPQGARITSTLILLLLYAAAAVQLVALFGVAAMRRVTPKVIIEDFGQT